jgi:hypothetical protein
MGGSVLSFLKAEWKTQDQPTEPLVSMIVSRAIAGILMEFLYFFTKFVWKNANLYKLIFESIQNIAIFKGKEAKWGPNMEDIHNLYFSSNFEMFNALFIWIV